MSDSCNCIDIKVEVILDEPEINCEVDVSEVILCSDGEDYKRGYEEGHAQGLVDGRADGYESGYDVGYEKGKAESGGGVDYLPYVQTITFSKTSSLSEITDDITLHLENATTLNQSFFGCLFSCNKITIYISEKCTSLYRLFGYGSATNSGSLKEIQIVGSTSEVANFRQSFYNRIHLERIIGEVDFSGATAISDMFTQCQSLKEFYPKAETIKLSISLSSSPDLTDETIQAIVDGLVDLTGQDSQVLTLHATVKAKLTEEQIATITSRNWTLA